MLKKFLFQLAKSPRMGRMVGIAFQYCGWAIPVKKIYSSQDVLAFRHPRPSYENHVIISPRKAVQNLQQLAADGACSYFVKIWEAAKAIRAAHPEYHDAFALVANGGKRQEVQQVHFHLFTGHEMVSDSAAQTQADSVIYHDRDVCILIHPQPDWEIHWIARPASLSQTAGNKPCQPAYFQSILRGIDTLNAEFDIVQKGYSLVYQRHSQSLEQECPVFHIVSGRKLQ